MPKTSAIIFLLLLLAHHSALTAKTTENTSAIHADTDSTSIATATERPVTQAYSIEVGADRALSTYLSPLHYQGPQVALSGQWSKRLPWQHNSWRMAFDTRLGGAYMLNGSKTAVMINASLMFGWRAQKLWHLPHGIAVGAGAGTGLSAGLLWLTRNGNNPVSARAAFSIGASALAAWHFRIGKLDVSLSDEVSLPSLSIFFSPQYGETYYEIYLGNHSGLVHMGWWGNRFCIDNLLAADLDIGPAALRLGYRFGLESSYVCHINTHIFTHSFVIGWIPHGIGLRRHNPGKKAVAITSIY